MKTLLAIAITLILGMTGCASLKDVFNSGPTTSTPHKARHVKREKQAPYQGELSWPVEGTVKSDFGKRGNGNHDGIDIFAKKGSSVVAAGSGEVVYSGKLNGYGNLIIVRHKHEYFTVYAHNEKNLVKKGKKVKRGETEIAKVGSTGNATGPHLHFEVRHRETPQDPLKYLPNNR